MFLKALEMENIRSYRREAISFDGGIALFEGDIGSGKSTILYAIEFALFGLGDLKSTFLLRNGEKEGRVKLIMEIDGSEVSFVRSLARKKGGAAQKDCHIIRGGIRTDLSPEEMKQEALKILKFNENPSPSATSLIYRYAVFTPQEEMKEILRLREDLRLETLRRAFGIEEYRIAKSNTALISKEIKERETFLAGSTKDMDALILEKKELQIKIEKAEEDAEGLKQKSDALGRRGASLKNKIDAHRQIKALFDALAGKLPQLRERHNDKRALAAELEKTIFETEKEIAERTRRLEALCEEKKPTEKADEELEDELRRTREMLLRLSAETGVLKNSVHDAQKAVAEAKELEVRLHSISLQIKNIGAPKKPTGKTEEELDEELFGIHKEMSLLLRDAGAKKESLRLYGKLIDEKICPTCGQDIEPLHFVKKEEHAKKSFMELEAQLKELASKEQDVRSMREELTGYILSAEKLSGIMREKAMIEAAYDAAKNRSAELEPLKASFAEKTEALVRAQEKEKEISGIHKALQEYVLVQTQCSQLRAELALCTGRLDSAKSSHSSIASEISSIRLEIEKLEREMNEKKDAIRGLQELETELERTKKDEESLAKLFGEADATLRALNGECRKISEALAQKEAEKKEAETLAETRMWLEDYFFGALASIERHVLAGINQEFNSLFQRLFGMLMDEGELSVNVNEFFTPAVVQNGYEQEISALSGGEKTSVALAYRLALNSIVKNVCSSMNGSGLLILDEPTDGFSKEQLMRLRDVLAELACRQVIIVSHERELESFADHIYRVKKTGSVSVVERGG